MRKGTKAAMIVGFVVTAFSAAGAQAQIIEPMRFKTTFPFTVGQTNFSPGTYTLRPLDTNDNGVVQISNGSTTKLINVQPASIKLNEKVNDEIVFKKQGDTYV